jgi:hypothetical protein
MAVDPRPPLTGVETMKATVKGNTLYLELPLSDQPTVSNSEAAKAAKEKRDPRALVLGTTGGFIRAQGDRACRISANVLIA